MSRLLLAGGATDLILLDSRGAIYSGREDLNPVKAELAKITNQRKVRGGLVESLAGADVFIGVSKGNLVTQKMVKSMSSHPIIFAMANPVPEIMPNLAKSANSFCVIGTGRSDFSNQINNALVFPGIFRGLLDHKVKQVTTKIKIRAALALAQIIRPKPDRLLPSVTEKGVVKAIAKAVR